MDFRAAAGYPPRLMPRSRRAPHVHKFGGASLADSAAVRHAVDIIRRHHQESTVVVVSAMAGTTDALLGVAQQAGAGESRTVASLIAQLRSRHAEVARALLPAGRGRADALAYISDVFEELEALAHGLQLLRELTPRTTDYLASRGEEAAAALLAVTDAKARSTSNAVAAKAYQSLRGKAQEHVQAALPRLGAAVEALVP